MFHRQPGAPRRPASTVRRHLLHAATLAVACCTLPAFAQDFPTKAVQIIVPYPPGGLTDVVARYVAQALSVKWKQPVVVENKGGGGTTIGTALVARAVPDGTTLMFTSTGYVTNFTLMKSLPYTAEQFTPIAMGTTAPNVLYVNPQLPVSNLAELVAYGKAHPGQLKFASTGNGSSTHLTAELLASKAGFEMIHVPYKGAAPALADLLAGHVNAMFHFPTSMNQVREGKLKAIAVSSNERLPDEPNLPTFAEAGVPGVLSSSWFGFFVPAATPAAIKDKLYRDIAEVESTPQFRKFAADGGMLASKLDRQGFARFIDEEQKRWATVIKQRGITLE